MSEVSVKDYYYNHNLMTEGTLINGKIKEEKEFIEGVTTGKCRSYKEDDNINETKKCVCPKGTIKYAVFIKDKNNNKLCSVCKKIEI
jgi:hypothetical protein